MSDHWGPPADWRNHAKRHRRRWQRHGGKWRGRSPFLFFRFAFIFGVMALLLVGGFSAMAYVISRVFGGGSAVTWQPWFGVCGVALALVVVATSVARRAFRSIATPLADIMSAADSVADGDLTVRIPEEKGSGDFVRLAQSFNRMVEELQRAESQRRHLTSDVAHELRNPIHVLKGNLEGLVYGVYKPTEEQFNAMLEEINLLSRLVEDLQTLSLAEEGRLPIHWETVDLAVLMEDVHTSFSGQAAAAGVELRIEVQGQPLTIQGDTDRLNQVLSNLVANALRHTPVGGKIALAAREVEKDIELTVADSGEGIAAEDLPYIFDRFWRGDRTRSHTDGSGAGLGLAIARQLVQAHGGEINVESTLGKGARFMILLPKTHEAKEDLE